MKEKILQSERGQTVVIVAFAIIALLAFAGLAIDGGSAYLNRRRMQNAADSGALAGAQTLAEAACDELSATAADAAILAAMNDYAIRNGVDTADDVLGHYVHFVNNEVVEYSPAVVVGGGAVPNGAVGVVVSTTITRPTYLLTLVGQPEGGAQATATAVTGPPLVAGGLRPFGVPVQMFESLDAGDCFTSVFKNCDEDAPMGDPNACYIYDDSGNIIGQHRNWLNLNHVWNQGEADAGFPRATGAAGNAADLADWMENGWDGTLYADCLWVDTCGWGDFIHAKPGTDSSVIGHVPINEMFFVPLYDVVPAYEDIPTPKAAPVAQGGSNGYYYHIVGFLGIRVDAANQGGGWIHACIEEVIVGEGQASPSPGFGSDMCEFNTLVVSLWR